MMTEDMFAQKGWICPKCGRVLAPSTMYCLWCCSDMKESITTTGTSIPKWNTTPIKVGSGMINSNGTGGSYFVETSSISRDSHEIAKDEPQTNKDFKVTYTCSFTECDNFKNFGFGEKCIECKRKQSEAKHKDEPQTCSVNGRPYSDCGNCEHFRCTADEPQTDYGDYERAVEQMQHDMRYEPTYNGEDGSM